VANVRIIKSGIHRLLSGTALMKINASSLREMAAAIWRKSPMAALVMAKAISAYREAEEAAACKYKYKHTIEEMRKKRSRLS